MSATYVLGVDGGNSKTQAVLATTGGEVLGAGRTGNGNHQGQGIEAAQQAIDGAVRAALRQAGISPHQVAYASYALAGADLPEDFERLRPALVGLRHARQLTVDNDTMAALRAGTDAPTAAVIINGAGFNAAARHAGRELRLPGLGWASGDWGGGGDLAREAFRLVCRQADGRGEKTLMTPLFLAWAGLAEVETLISALYNRRLPRDFLLSLPPLVFLAAERGDAVARGLLQRLAEESALTAATLLRRLEALEVPAEVVLAGGLLAGERPLLQQPLRRRLAELAPLARPVILTLPPVLGAVQGALELAGVDTATTRARLAESYTALAGAPA